jgi:hydroxypyruvate isomerase
MNHSKRVARNNRIKHSVSLWCYAPITVEQLAPAIAEMGMAGIDLLTPEQFAPLKKHNLVCTMTCGPYTIEAGLNRKENHGPILQHLKTNIERTADAGFPNVICFSGNRHIKKGNKLTQKMSDEEGMKNCAAAVKKVIGLAERKKVTICIELLNSKVDHQDYMCDHTDWAVELVKKIGSERFKVLYDIYHMQIMEGDIIRTLRDNIQYIGHVHTGGNPGRNEIDQTQELNYPAIMQALVDLKYDGYVAQEFVPAKKDKLASLAAAVKLCDV